MSFTGVIGGPSSELGNIDLGFGAAPPVPSFPFLEEDQSVARKLRSRLPASRKFMTADVPVKAIFPPVVISWLPSFASAETKRPSQTHRPKATGSPTDAFYLTGYIQPPGPPSQSLRAPLLTRTPYGPDIEKRQRYNFDVLSEMINSLTRQGYIQKTHANPPIWKIIADSSSLTPSAILAALGPQSSNVVLAGSGPSFRGLAMTDLPVGVFRATHLVGATTPPSIVIGTGAGAAGTASIAGTDISGTITVTTDVADTPASNATIATVTFNTQWATAPVVTIMPSNDAAWSLTYGIARLRQGDVTVNLFTIRSGSTPLPATTAATYTWNYVAIG